MLSYFNYKIKWFVLDRFHRIYKGKQIRVRDSKRSDLSPENSYQALQIYLLVEFLPFTRPEFFPVWNIVRCGDDIHAYL